jgi:trigger factor
VRSTSNAEYDLQITVEDLSPVKKRIGVELPAEEVRAEMEQAFRGLQQRARIKGFRPGHVPRAILERYYGEQVRSEVIGKLIQDSYARALDEHGLRAVARPEIVAEEVRPETGVRYSATIEIKPEFEVVGHEGLAVERHAAAVDDAAIDAQLERLRQSLAQMVRREDRDTVEAGDLVEIGYTGVVDGHVLPGATVESRIVEIGSQTFPPPFEDKLIGLKRGASTHVEVPYPTHHRSAEIAGKTVTFRVEIKEVGRKELPALDDEFAKDHGECASLAELRDKVRHGLEAAAAREADDEMRAALLRGLIARNPITIPEALVERRFDAMLHELGLHDAKPSGDAERDAQLDRIRGELRARAQESVHSGLLLERLAAQQGLQVDDAEIDARVAQIVRAAPRERERLAEIYRAPEARGEIAERVAQEKALDWIARHAVVTEVTPKLIADAEKKS